MAYRLPTFNLLMGVYYCHFPVDGGPDYTDVPCQKYVNSKPQNDVTPQYTAGWWQNWVPPIMIRTPHDVPFDSYPMLWQSVCVEVPQGSGQYYRAFWGEIMHQGFPNEYAALMVTQCDIEGAAIMPPGGNLPVDVRDDQCS